VFGLAPPSSGGFMINHFEPGPNPKGTLSNSSFFSFLEFTEYMMIMGDEIIRMILTA
jgi:hypothetical protein